MNGRYPLIFMERLLSTLSTLTDLALVIGGFTLIIVIHELGHFIAARWAGIRVMAFAVGFGPAIVSYRKGYGLRRGSSEQEYLTRVAAAKEDPAQAPALAGVSATEYRWNYLPLGGYVKMLGQDDSDPTATSTESDSYQSASPWKRMVVISAGVIFNVILAAVLFVGVFTVGLPTEPCKVGFVAPGSPAFEAVASNAGTLGIKQSGLQPGDEIVRLEGEIPQSFKDLTLASAMASPNEAIAIDVVREGVAEPLHFLVVPREDPYSRMLSIGVGPASGSMLDGAELKGAAKAEAIAGMRQLGLAMAEPGMTLVRVGDRSAAKGSDGLAAAVLVRAAEASGGAPIEVEFARADGTTVVETLKPEPALATRAVQNPSTKAVIRVGHLAGLVPVMQVRSASKNAAEQGLAAGDVFVRLGDMEWPSVAEGIAEIKRGGRTEIAVTVAREVGGEVRMIKFPMIKVVNGTIGFSPGDTSASSTLVARWPVLPEAKTGGFEVFNGKPAGARLGLTPGSKITAVNGRPVASFAEVWLALAAITDDAAGVRLTVSSPVTSGETLAWPKRETGAEHALALGAEDLKELSRTRWSIPLAEFAFEPERMLLQGADPAEAIGMGLHETLGTMKSTYLTFLRLFQGTVKVEHLKGPVGIADVGTQLASRGFVWLLFFMGLVSVNLAVVNFLPLPIVDGGQFLMIIYEQVTGKPVSVQIQANLARVGLLFVVCVFLFVTFNDVAKLIWRN